jgi:hypothetical protein
MSAPIRKYKTNFSRNRIEQVAVDRETKTSVFIGTTRCAKVGSYAAYHDSWDEAHAFLMSSAESEVGQARLRLETANGKLGNIKGMKAPQGDTA